MAEGRAGVQLRKDSQLRTLSNKRGIRLGNVVRYL